MDKQMLVGNTIGSYEVLRELGQGGMGIVYKAHEQSLQRVVALKVLPEHLARDPSFVRRFQREAQAAAQLNHPNIVTIHAVGESGGVHFIAMEYIRGKTLGHHIQEQGQLDVRHALRIARQSAEALAEAHRRGIIHRDIKPSNIMLDEAGRVKVMDFGLAKALHGASEITVPGTQLGTPRYMSPEQIEGKPLDARSDLFSLGLVLAEMLTGQASFSAETPSTAMYQIVHQELPNLRDMNPEIPAVVAELIGKMTAKAPEDRPASAQAVLRDIDFILDHAPEMVSLKEIHEAPTMLGSMGGFSAQEASSVPKRGKRRMAVILAAVVVVMGAAAGILQFLATGGVAGSLPDEQLRAAVREALNMPQGRLAKDDVARLETLTADDRGIVDITGLERCTNLVEARLTRNKIANLEPLANLKSLETLSLAFNKVRDVAPLGNLTNLRHLYLDWNAVSDIRPLAALRQLECLNLNSNRVSDISPLVELKQLSWVELSDNRFVDYQPLTQLTRLRILNLDDTKGPDLTALSGLRDLQHLQLARCGITDISALAPLENLEVLFLHGNSIKDISALKAMHKLHELILSGNEISDLTPLAENPGFGEGDVLYLAGCPEYAGLVSGGNPLSDAALRDQIPLLAARGVKVVTEE